uniref:ethanolamine ammonia-lyase subunit EutB n=1 Tax=uncultured Abyssibacter sp. TaxID=2320202 RepID=UPI0032B1A686
MSAPAVYRCPIGHRSFQFSDLREVLAKASPARSGDALAGLAAGSMAERVAAQTVLADVPLADFLDDPLIPYETDEVTRLIVDTHDAAAFAPVAGLTVGAFRDWLLAQLFQPEALRAITPGLTPEMVAAVSKLMRNQDLILVASKLRVVTAFRNTLGLPGRFSVRLQPNHPTDALAGIAASTLDGLLLGAGDACIGVNPVSDDPAALAPIWRALDRLIERFEIPTQSCVLAHVTQ